MFTELVPGIAMRLLQLFKLRNDKFRVIIANAVRIVIARSLLRRRGHLLAMELQATCDEIASAFQASQ